MCTSKVTVKVERADRHTAILNRQGLKQTLPIILSRTPLTLLNKIVERNNLPLVS